MGTKKDFPAGKCFNFDVVVAGFDMANHFFLKPHSWSKNILCNLLTLITSIQVFVFFYLILDSQLQVQKFLHLFSQAYEEGIQDTLRDGGYYLNLTPFSHTGELYASLWTESTEQGRFLLLINKENPPFSLRPGWGCFVPSCSKILIDWLLLWHRCYQSYLFEGSDGIGRWEVDVFRQRHRASLITMSWKESNDIWNSKVTRWKWHNRKGKMELSTGPTCQEDTFKWVCLSWHQRPES